MEKKTLVLKKIIGITAMLLMLLATINAYNAIVTLNPSSIKYGTSPPIIEANYIAGDSTYTNNVFIANDSACANNIGGNASTHFIDIDLNQISGDVSLVSGTKYYFCIKLRERVSTHAVYANGANGANACAIDFSASSAASHYFETDSTDRCNVAVSSYYFHYYIGASGAQDIATFSWWFYA